MQKFLVCQAVGGASVTFGALAFLIKDYGDGLDPTHMAMNECPGKVTESDGRIGYPARGVFSPLLTKWWTCYSEQYARLHDGERLEFGAVKDDSCIRLRMANASEIRDMLVPYVERMRGHYAMLDELNGGTPLRVVEVPDGYLCTVLEDPETGCEYVEELRRVWNTRSDDEYRFIANVQGFIARDASKHDWYEEDTLYDLSTVRGRVGLVISGKYGVARCETDEGNVTYLFIRRNEYYRATPDHPEKVMFEIVGLNQCALVTENPFKDAEEVLAYAKLALELENELGKKDET